MLSLERFATQLRFTGYFFKDAHKNIFRIKLKKCGELCGKKMLKDS